MKKLLAVSIMGLLGMTSVYADIISITPNNFKTLNRIETWEINNGTIYGYLNLFGKEIIKSRFMVNEYTDMYTHKKTDRVTFNCNGEYSYLEPGKWTFCGIKPENIADVQIAIKDFHNGATVYFEIME